MHIVEIFLFLQPEKNSTITISINRFIFNQMKIKNLLSAGAIAALALFCFSASAGNIDANAARMAAKNFINQHAGAQGRFKATANADIKLTHTEVSSVEGNAYYVFNIQGGGWVIVAGDDRAKQVLAYNTEGSIDMNNLPAPTKGYLNMFKAQIETMQNYKGEVVPLKAPKRRTPIGPLMKTNWAQGNPFNRQCPQHYSQEDYTYDYSSVGCAGLSMAQILYYWQYPKELPALSSYTNTYYQTMEPALPARSIDYDLIADQYTTWTESGSLAWMPGITDEQKQEVAWLCRYAAQSCEMNFSPDGSGSNVSKQKNGFLKMGFSSEAKLLGLEAWPARETWNTEDYTDEEWVNLIDAQLEDHHPIPYSSEDFTDGHAFVIDGVDADGLYHVNWGWYGRCDGYFQYGAFNVAPQGTTFYFNNSLFMVVDLYPYEGYVSPNDPGSTEPQFQRGDVNDNGDININDVTILINYLLSKDATGINLDAADCNQDNNVTISDVTALINYLLSKQW